MTNKSEFTKHEQRMADGGTKSKKVIYLDKPLPRRTPDVNYLNEQCHKRLIRTNLCHLPGIVHPNSETTRMNPNCYKRTTKTSRTLPEDEVEMSPRAGSIICTSEDDDDGKEPNQNTIHHNVTYRIWNIKQENDQNVLMKGWVSKKEIKFLVRCKIDACELLENETTRPLVVVPKFEFQLEHGANISTKRELIHQWTDLFFRPFSHLYRIRMQSSTSEVVAVESVDMQKINTEAATHYEYKPNLRLGILHTIFTVLTTLEPGNYVLHHTAKIGPFAELLKEADPDFEVDETNTFDLHSAYSSKNCLIQPATHRPWCPIDVNYVLPVHAAFKRMPGMFKPLILSPKQFKKGNKGAKKKRKKGKKAANAQTNNVK